jgi:hypothetical protein
VVSAVTAAVTGYIAFRLKHPRSGWSLSRCELRVPTSDAHQESAGRDVEVLYPSDRLGLRVLELIYPAKQGSGQNRDLPSCDLLVGMAQA